MNPFTLIGLLLSLSGCLAIYLSAPNQQWRVRAWPSRPARLGGALLLVLGWLSLAQAMQALAATFVFLTFLMLVFALLPYTGAVLQHGRER